MNRDRDARTQEGQSFSGALGIHMSRTEIRTPSPDGQKSHVQIICHVNHSREQICIPWKINLLGSLDKISQAIGGWIKWRVSAIMFSVRGHDSQRSNPGRIPRPHLFDITKTPLVE